MPRPVDDWSEHGSSVSFVRSKATGYAAVLVGIVVSWVLLATMPFPAYVWCRSRGVDLCSCGEGTSFMYEGSGS